MGIRWPGSLFVGYTRRPLARCQPPDTRSASSRRRATCRFAKPQQIHHPWVFFARPRYHTLAHPKILFIAEDICSTLARTCDFVQLRALRLTERPMTMGSCVDEGLDLWGAALNHLALSAAGGLAPNSLLLAVHPVRRYLTVMHARRRGRHRMNQLGPAIHTDTTARHISLEPVRH